MLFLAGIDRIPVVKQWEKELSYKLVKYWSNFAKYGNPNEAPELNDLPNWGTYELKNEEYIDINTNITIKGFPNARATDFWLNLIQVLVSSEQTEKPGCMTSIAASPSHVFGQALLVSFSLLLM